jgi:hypothetical protein
MRAWPSPSGGRASHRPGSFASGARGGRNPMG